MQIYEVRISRAARIDMANLRAFLGAMLSEEGAVRYANSMREEIKDKDVGSLCRPVWQINFIGIAPNSS